jgi:hypothetical protein
MRLASDACGVYQRGTIAKREEGVREEGVREEGVRPLGATPDIYAQD